MRIIAIDPGVTTGFCYAELDEDLGKVEYDPFQWKDEVNDLWERLYEFKPDVIICEDFEHRRGNYQGGLNLFPVQLIGVTRLFSLNEGVPIFLQKAAQGKSYYTDPILKQLNLYRRGIPHGMDASRHLLQWCMFGSGYQYMSSKKTEECVTLLDGEKKGGED